MNGGGEKKGGDTKLLCTHGGLSTLGTEIWMPTRKKGGNDVPAAERENKKLRGKGEGLEFKKKKGTKICGRPQKMKEFQPGTIGGAEKTQQKA